LDRGYTELRGITLLRTPVNKTKRRPESRQLGLDKASGAPFLGKFFAGMDLGFRPDDTEDLSEPRDSLPLGDPGLREWPGEPGRIPNHERASQHVTLASPVNKNLTSGLYKHPI